MTVITKKGLALLGGQRAVTTKAPAWPVVTEEDARRMAEVVRSGKWSWFGPHELAFSKEFADFIGSKYALCLSNGTVTIQCALQGVGVKPGDEVIVPGLTWVATAQAALDVGANVVLVDIDPETLCLDPAAVRAAITPKTKAIIPVQLYGCMCDMDAIMSIAKERSLKVVEDVAHQHGSRWRDKGAGAIGDAGSFSFQQSKVLTCGEGGAVTCNNEEVFRIVFAMKQVGWVPDPAVPYVPGQTPKLVASNRYGHNYRMTEMQALLLRGGLTRLEEQTKRREEFALRLAEGLKRIGGPLRAARRDPCVTRQAYYAMTFVFDPAQAGGLTRAQYAQAIGAEGCPLGPPYAPVYRCPLMNLYDETSPVPYRDAAKIQNYAGLKLPNTERACNETALVMSHPNMLGGADYADQMLEGFRKVNDNLAALREHFAAQDRCENRNA